MTYLALAALGLVLVQGLAFAGLLRWTLRSLDRERQASRLTESRLIDQVCHLADKPWTPAPLRPVPDLSPQEPELDFVDIDEEPN